MINLTKIGVILKEDEIVEVKVKRDYFGALKGLGSFN